MSISEDQNEEEIATAEPSPAAVPEPRVITLRDVQAQSPAESVEETVVLRSLERSNPIGTASRILNEVTGPLPPVLVEEAPATVATVADQLFEATNSLNNLQIQAGDEAPPATVFIDQTEAATTQTDAFAANAGKLFHRFQSSRPPKQDTPDDVEEAGRKRFRWYRQARLDRLKDFKMLVDSRKTYMYQYTRNTLLFVILPSTGLAAM